MILEISVCVAYISCLLLIGFKLAIYQASWYKYLELRMSLILVQGKWTGSSNWSTLLDPLNGEQFIRIAEVGEKEIQVFSLCVMHGGFIGLFAYR